jgi:hypothetical protein
MSKKALSAEEMRMMGLQMIRKAREKVRAEKLAQQLKLGELLEQHIATGFTNFSLNKLVVQIEKITGHPVALSETTLQPQPEELAIVSVIEQKLFPLRQLKKRRKIRVRAGVEFVWHVTQA